LRVGIAGNILELAGPKKVLAEKFLSFKVSLSLSLGPDADGRNPNL
jgi:hypothetical protein